MPSNITALKLFTFLLFIIVGILCYFISFGIEFYANEIELYYKLYNEEVSIWVITISTFLFFVSSFFKPWKKDSIPILPPAGFEKGRPLIYKDEIEGRPLDTPKPTKATKGDT